MPAVPGEVDIGFSEPQLEDWEASSSPGFTATQTEGEYGAPRGEASPIRCGASPVESPAGGLFAEVEAIPGGQTWEQKVAEMLPDTWAVVEQLVGVQFGTGCQEWSCGTMNSDRQDRLIKRLDYPELRFRKSELCRICLGELHDVGFLSASISAPQNYLEPTLTDLDLLQELMPEYRSELDRALNAGFDKSAIRFNRQKGDSAYEPVPGLFWTGDVWKSALKLAIIQIYAMANYAARPYGQGASPNPCNATAANIRDHLGRSPRHAVDFQLRQQGPICSALTPNVDVWANGYFEVVKGPRDERCDKGKGSGNLKNCKNGAGEGIGGDNYIVICKELSFFACRADYLLWWANRLLLDAQACGSQWKGFMAVVCARSAIADISRLSGFLLHELGHVMTNTGGHCETAFVVAPNIARECCTAKLERGFKHSVQARFGLPLEGNQFEKFRSAIVERMETDCTDVWFRHCGVLRKERHVDVLFTTPNECTPGQGSQLDGVADGRYLGPCFQPTPPPEGGGHMGPITDFREPLPPILGPDPLSGVATQGVLL